MSYKICYARVHSFIHSPVFMQTLTQEVVASNDSQQPTQHRVHGGQSFDPFPLPIPSVLRQNKFCIFNISSAGEDFLGQLTPTDCVKASGVHTFHLEFMLIHSH